MHQGILRLIGALMLMVMLCCCSNSTEHPMDEKLKNAYFAMCYTAEFAKRFSLPVEKAMALSQGLQAIAIEVRPAAKMYRTFIHLYLDSSLDVYSPGGECNYYRKPQAEWFFPKKYNDEDSQWNMAFIQKAGMRMMYRSQSLNQPDERVVQTLEMDTFRREFLPNLNLLTTSEINGSYIEKRYGPGEVLVQKNSVGDYLLVDEHPGKLKFPENSYVFKIPEKLHNAIQPYLAHADTKFKHIDESKDPLVEFP